MRIVAIALMCGFALAQITLAGEPDHLVPVDPHPGTWHVGYSDELNNRFKLWDFFFAQMLVMPSFEGEFVVRLHGRKGEQFIEAKEFFLTYSVADKSIANSLRPPLEVRIRGKHHSTRKEKVRVSTTTVEISKELATRILRLWEQMLLRMRYREQDVVKSTEIERVIGMDGTTFEFGVWLAFGETWSPQERLSPLLLVEVGAALIDYCKAPAGERAAATKQIEAKAAELEKYLSEHPAN